MNVCHDKRLFFAKLGVVFSKYISENFNAKMSGILRVKMVDKHFMYLQRLLKQLKKGQKKGKLSLLTCKGK